MSKIKMDDVEFLSTKPRVRGKVILDDWHKTLRFENYKWIHSFEGFEGLDNKRWIAKLTSRGENIIKTYEEYKIQNNEINNIEEFFEHIN